MPMIGRIRDMALTSDSALRPRVDRLLLLCSLGAAACSNVGGIDATKVATVSNEDAYATLGGIWTGARAAITSPREPRTPTFTLPISFTRNCPAGGQSSYQGTLTGTDTAGTGSATVALTAVLTNCAFDDRTRVTTVSATGVSIAGTIAISSDTYGAINLRLIATSVIVNGKDCTGGINMALQGSSPLAQPTASGTVCGRSGVVPLP